MAIKKFKPTSPGRRFMSTLDNIDLTKNYQVEKSLLRKIKNNSGRNNSGKITVRHKGGRHKRKYRVIDYKRNKDNIPAIVKSIQYDPNRSANIALICYSDGTKSYILCPDKLKVGDKVQNGKNSLIKIGNCLKIKDIPEGTFIHNIELKENKGGQLARSAGSYGKILGKEEKGLYYIIQLVSGEVRKINGECRATIGTVGNKYNNLVNYGKAGRIRKKGIRPTVRGSAMNPIDHPHGGGEGKTGIGRKSPMTPWGKKALGVKTRKLKKKSSKYIVRFRARKK